MTAQDLKNSILQLAVQGKLVPQDPNEIPVDLTKCNLSEMDELPFDIPDTWEIADIEAISKTVPSKQYQIKESEVCKEGTYIVISQSKDYSIGFSNDATKLFRHSNPVVVFGDHTTEVKHIDFDFVVGADGVKIFEPNAEIIYSKFFYFVLLFYTLGIKDAGGYSRHYKFVKAKPFPIPPLAEQKRIVAKIEELLPYIEEYDRAEKQLSALNAEFPDKLRKSILQQAVMGKLTERDPADEPASELLKRIRAEKERLVKEGKIKKDKPLPEITDDEKPFDIPESWKWVRIAQVVILNPKNDLDDTLEVGFIPMTCVSDSYQNKHTFEVRKWKDIKKGFTHFANGDIGVAKITPCFQNRKSVIFKKLPNGFGAGTTELTVSRIIGDTLCPEYLLWFFKTDYFISNGVKSFTGTAGQQRIHKDYLPCCLFPLPPIEEQKRIVAKLEQLLPLCERLK